MTKMANAQISLAFKRFIERMIKQSVWFRKVFMGIFLTNFGILNTENAHSENGAVLGLLLILDMY